jgi:hypothetical protein
VSRHRLDGERWRLAAVSPARLDVRLCGGGPTHDDQRDVIARYDIAEEVSHDVAGDAVGSTRCHRVL